MSKKIYGGLAIQNAQELGLFDSDSSNSVQLKAPASISADYVLTLPTALGSAGQSLKIDGSGAMSFESFILAALSDGNILVGNGSNIATAVDSAAVGDIDVDSTAGLTIKAGVIVDADVNASAAITLSKLAATTASRALASDASGFIVPSAVTSVELGYVSGVTSGIQSQLNTLSSTIQNFEWQPSALSYVVDNTAVPASEVSGDRYVLSDDGGAPHANYDGASAGDIVEFNGTIWIATTPSAGTFVSVDDNSTGLYLFGGATWELKFFEATTASTGLTKVGFDVRLDSSAAGEGLVFTTGVLSVGVDNSTLQSVADSVSIKDGGITNAKINASAAIALNKLAATTVSRALVSDGSGFVSPSAVTSTELGYVSGVSSAIQTQMDAKAGTALDNLSIASLAAEDILVASSGSAVGRLVKGSDGQVLKMVAGSVAWAADNGTDSFKADWITADTTTKVITHSLGTTDVIVQIFDKADGSSIDIDSIARTSTNVVTVISSQAPGASGWRVMILKV